MSSDRDDNPDVIDLRRYRKAAQQKAKARRAAPTPKPAQPANPESLLGRRRHAGLILTALVVALIALSVGPKLVTLTLGWLSFALG